MAVFMEASTSAESISSPSWNLTPFLRWKVQVRPSSEVSQLSARHGWNFMSASCISIASYIWSITWLVGPSSYLYGSMDRISEAMAITRLSFPEALSCGLPASAAVPPAPAAVVVPVVPPPQPARHPAVIAAATNNDIVLFFILILLLF